MRLFVGLALPAEVARELERRTREAPVRWGHARLAEADDLHVTLRFLGEVEESRVADISEAIYIASIQPSGVPASVSLSSVAAFRGAGAIYTAVQDADVPLLGTPGRLTGLYESLSHALARRGFPRELRPFVPHVTLARRRHGLPREDLERWNSEWTALAARLDALVLYQSVGTATAGEPRYKRLRKLPL